MEVAEEIGISQAQVSRLEKAFPSSYEKIYVRWRNCYEKDLL